MKRSRPVIPAKARPRAGARNPSSFDPWTPAFAGVTDRRTPYCFPKRSASGGQAPALRPIQRTGRLSRRDECHSVPSFTRKRESIFCTRSDTKPHRRTKRRGTACRAPTWNSRSTVSHFLIPPLWLDASVYPFGIRSSLTMSVATRPYSSGVIWPASYASKCGRKAVPTSPQVG